ncbi:hypothetical protein PV10_08627 [Exophiala mesophila]|uniref:Uncharacterized protein n=1 Tax=Exophiala mesophila TaxID=212818 RepID=A0A0D1ZQJ6_EXOME|nr:uncharacterized protein PV10_08627 [Exophiala mesophila]KIV89008.1 hypothetical protein PV10_08627 [Exophiala mesophila]
MAAPASASARARKLDLGGFLNIRILRDHTKRKAFEQAEPHRQALRYMIRNTKLPESIRQRAVLELNQMSNYTRRTQIKNRCVMGGVARGVFRAFRLGRYQFRELALEGSLPGVKKASW